MGKGRNGTNLTKRKQRLERRITKKKGKNANIGSINDPNRVIPKNATHLRDRATIKRIKMYKCRAIRNKKGEIIREKFMRRDTDDPVSRIHPDRRWFGNTKIITQKQLSLFRDEMKKNINDPYTIVLKHKKIPYGLIQNNAKKLTKMNLLSIESYDYTFGPKSQRKKPKFKSNSIENLMKRALKSHEMYDINNDNDNINYKLNKLNDWNKYGIEKDPIFFSGQSQRIRNELYKVIDSSDIILYVLDGRDPIGTRQPHIEKYLKTNCKHKHFVLILNKIDLIPIWVTKRWLKILSQEYPCIAFKSNNNNNNFGKGALISLLRQYKILMHRQKKTLSVGLIGMPNVGKSSIINVLVNKKVCSTAPIPGQTKVWQYISLFDKFYLIDCPGVVYPRKGDTHVTSILRSIVRIENVKQPWMYVDEILKRVRKEYLQKLYNIDDWKDSDEFMDKLARKRGRLLKGNEPDLHNIGVMILNDWQRGRLPWFVCPPFEDDIEFERKLREKEREFLEEKQKFDEGDHIVYQPVMINHNNINSNDNNESKEDKKIKCNIGDIKDNDIDLLTHDFLDDEKEIYLNKINGINNDNNDVNMDMDEDKQYYPKNDNERNEFNRIKVDNPLQLNDDDPLIFGAKLREWKKIKYGIHC